MSDLTRRTLIASALAGAALPAHARSARELTWEDLIPPGVPYGEIIGMGDVNEAQDTWNPVFDENAIKLNESLNGEYVRLPGFGIPLELGPDGTSNFVLVPYVGACIHVPPPPPNQLVMVHSAVPWPSDQMWVAVWVTGTLKTQLQTNVIAQTGYALAADAIDIYEW
ncbi:MAG: DUF3299 domain-containing protein [Arenibacterium sp.]